MSSNSIRVTVFLGIVFLMLSTVVQAGPLKKRSRIELRGGLWNMGSNVTTRVGMGTVETTVENNSPAVSFGYAYWTQEYLAVMSAFTLLSNSVTTRTGVSGVTTSTSRVISLLVGVRYYVPRPDAEIAWRPYLAAGVGPYIGSEEKTQVGNQIVTESHTETAFGGYVGCGLDIQLSRFFMAGATVGTHLMTDFSEPLGGKKNYSSPEFSLGISFLFGRGVE